MSAQLAPLDHVFVNVIRALGTDQFTLDSGVFYADGRYVSDNNPTAAPLFLLGLSQAQFTAINGKPLFPLLLWDNSGQYSRFQRSAATYNILGTDYFIISAIGTSATAPAITTQPASQTVNTGANVTITVTATGTAPLSYQWRKDGAAINGATSSTLLLTGVTTANAGSYSVVVSNSVSSVTSASAALIVSAPPSITTQPQSQTVTAGGSVTFNVIAAGSAPLSYQWRKDGTAIAGATNSTLVRSSVTTADAGSYSVVVSNSIGSVTSASATLIVTAQPVVTGAGDLFASEGNSPTRFYRVNPTNATTTLIGQTTFLPGLDFRANGVLYGSSDALYTVSMSTGAATRIGALPDLIVSIAFSPSDRLYGISNDGLTLYEIDPATGKKLSSVPLTGTTFSSGGAFLGEINGIDFGPDGTLYGIGFALYRISPATGVATRITLLGSYATSGGDLFHDLDFGVDGQLRAVAADSPSSLYTINPSTGIGQLVGSMGASIDGLASAPASATTPTTNSRLINLSVLTSLASTSDTFTLGYVVGGAGTSGSKPLVIRAAGPSLGALGVPGALIDPKIELFTGSTKTGENDNWGGTATILTAMASVGAFAYISPNSKDAAAVANIPAGGNSVIVSATDRGTGTVIAEIYDATPSASFTASTPRLINVSVLKNIGGSLTAGFVVGGTGTKTVLVRAVGPTLGAAPFGVPGVVGDPQMTLYAGQTVIATNDNWGTPVGSGSASAAQLSAAFTQVGAFALPAGSKDAALLATLAPGSYSVQVSGVGGTTGVGLVEVYEVP